MHAEIGVSMEMLQQRLGNRTDADLQCRPIGNALGNERSDDLVLLTHLGRCGLEQRIVGFGPACDLRDVDVVLAARARHVRIRLEKERRLPDERRHVIGVRAEGKPTVPIRQRRCREHHRVVGDMTQNVRHLGEMRRREITTTLGICLPGDRRQEIGVEGQS